MDIEKLLDGKAARSCIAILALGGGTLLLIAAYNKGLMDAPKGYNYSGVYLFGLGIAASMLAIIFPVYLLPQKILGCIDFLTKYTLGIYCMHRLIGHYILLLCDAFDMNVDSFALCVVIYITSFVAAFVLDTITKGRAKKLIEEGDRNGLLHYASGQSQV